MRKIRIGNDIRLILNINTTSTIVEDDGTQYNITVNDLDMTNIKQVRCYLINTPKKEDRKKFKRVGFPEMYSPTAYNINNSGFPSYHMEPANVCNYDRFAPDFHDFHWWPGFRGFGICPERFHDHCGHSLWHGPHPEHDHFPGHWYLADSWVLNEKNTLACMFPAIDQIMCGTYKLVVVITVFQKGWGKHNLRTYTIDKGDVFQLVDEGGESGPITIDVDTKGDDRKNMPEIEAIYTTQFSNECYTLVMGQDLRIGEQDVNESEYRIYVKLKDGSTLLYNPLDWKYDNLKFESPSCAVTVDKNGTLHAHCLTDPICITVSYGEGRSKVQTSFCVKVDPVIPLYVGFSTDGSFNNISKDKDNWYKGEDIWDVKKRQALDGVIDIHNPLCGGYLYIMSQRKIKYIKSFGEDIVSSSVRFPVVPGNKKVDNYFVYRSVAPIVGGGAIPTGNDVKFKLVYA